MREVESRSRWRENKEKSRYNKYEIIHRDDQNTFKTALRATKKRK